MSEKGYNSTVKAWGSSLGFRLPKAICDLKGIHDGTRIRVKENTLDSFIVEILPDKVEVVK